MFKMKVNDVFFTSTKKKVADAWFCKFIIFKYVYDEAISETQTHLDFLLFPAEVKWADCTFSSEFSFCFQRSG